MRVRSVALVVLLVAGCAGAPSPPVSPSSVPSTSPTAAPSPTVAPSPRATAQPAETSPASPSAAPVACRGRDEVNLTGIPGVARKYLAAWNEHDAQARLAILEEIWTAGGTYLESAGLADAPIGGRAAMSELIAQNQGPADQWFEVRAWQAGYVHHGRLLMPWRHCGPDGPTGVVGTDYAELDSDGQLVLERLHRMHRGRMPIWPGIAASPWRSGELVLTAGGPQSRLH